MKLKYQQLKWTIIDHYFPIFSAHTVKNGILGCNTRLFLDQLMGMVAQSRRSLIVRERVVGLESQHSGIPNCRNLRIKRSSVTKNKKPLSCQHVMVTRSTLAAAWRQNGCWPFFFEMVKLCLCVWECLYQLFSWLY